MSTADFAPSLLGTKHHWDERYALDLANFRESKLEGEVWFGEEPEEKMVEWAQCRIPPDSNPNVLDVGAGNGHLLFAMVEAGYDGSRLTGIDYSKGSVDLSIVIAKQRAEDDEDKDHAYDGVTFAVCDFLEAQSSVPPPKGESISDGTWDLILDKGTYDAISLMDKDEAGNEPLARYAPRVERLLKPGGYFLITSCNFTEDELKSKIPIEGSGLEYKESLPYRKFTFGGKSGSSYATISFRKRSASST